jgi:hypothetical protein
MKTFTADISLQFMTGQGNSWWICIRPTSKFQGYMEETCVSLHSIVTHTMDKLRNKLYIYIYL